MRHGAHRRKAALCERESRAHVWRAGAGWIIPDPRNPVEAQVQHEEYTVIPAPSRGEKAPGARTGAERFAHTLTIEINHMAARWWEYVRADDWKSVGEGKGVD